MTSGAGSRDRNPDELNTLLRALPSVDSLAASLGDLPRGDAVAGARAAVAEARAAILGGGWRVAGGGDAQLEAVARRHARARLRSVVNATGVIVHTNLGRAPLASSAVDAVVSVAAGYSNLEYDLEAGERGSRQAHVDGLLCELTGAEAAMVVGNCAGAVLLAAAALAGGRELVVSRGQLVEIGGSFRIPDVVAQSGARLVEVGTTNRTRVGDYRQAIGPDTGAVMRAHQSNFRTVGFVEEVEVEDLCALGVPVIDDVGSGALAHGVPELADEPPVRRSVAAGCAVVCFSGDKLLGGPQAGILSGARAAIEALRKNPIYRALRLDKVGIAGLEATLGLVLAGRGDELPVRRMLRASAAELRPRAEALARRLSELGGLQATLVESASQPGSGSAPAVTLPTVCVRVTHAKLSAGGLSAALRGASVPVFTRVHEGAVLLDPRTLLPGDEEDLVAAFVSVAR